jgi:serine protease inhibitor
MGNNIEKFVKEYFSTLSDYEKTMVRNYDETLNLLNLAINEYQINDKSLYIISYSDINLKEWYKEINLVYHESKKEKIINSDELKIKKFSKKMKLKIVNYGCENKQGNKMYGISFGLKHEF